MDDVSEGFEGLHPEAAHQTAGLLNAYAAQLETKIHEFGVELTACGWSGQDADRFRDDWSTTLSRNLGDAIIELRRHATLLTERADRQGAVSESPRPR
ncbi:hypothetical protein KIPE111705_39595 [Kibdelosporangium persicum]|uniref:WXG100 family type VII secretion target n=1 Tax=Kibdelosporangium persicum TaxID=2698649 RepID=A0ABX2FBI5_9PSEU|nr:hypothetical protein [Kibdelosporangium persicum]NRN68741.1 hypothetical protein [Kibdelosporangium persicum]